MRRSTYIFCKCSFGVMSSSFRVPAALAHFQPVIQRVADFEAVVNAACFDEYYCYLTVDQGRVRGGTLQREAPCHVDGFQGARWRPKVRCNHTYVISDLVPTVYYVQPFEVEHLDEARHNFFWEFNRQVAATGSTHAWRPQPYELNLMANVESDQRWGVPAAAGPTATAVYVKNGWLSSDSDNGLWVVNSIGRIVEPGHDWLIAILANHETSEDRTITLIQNTAALMVNGLS